LLSLPLTSQLNKTHKSQDSKVKFPGTGMPLPVDSEFTVHRAIGPQSILGHLPPSGKLSAHAFLLLLPPKLVYVE